MREALTILGDSKLVASNIKNGVDIFGVTGELLELSIYGISEYCVETITFAEQKNISWLKHSLGRIPVVMMLFNNEELPDASSSSYPYFMRFFGISTGLSESNSSSAAYICRIKSGGYFWTSTNFINLTSTGVSVSGNPTGVFPAGKEYTLITMA